MMTRALRLAQLRIEMRDRPDRLPPTVMEARRHKGRLLTGMLDRHRKSKLRMVRRKKKLRIVMRDHRRVMKLHISSPVVSTC